MLYNYDNTGVTVELGRLVEMGVDVWDFDYPSYYKGEEKTRFEQLVIDHYRFRQIGQETAGRWLHYFRTRIREIMPYYIQLYKSQALMDAIEDPFGNVDVTETYTMTTTGEHNSEVTVDNTETRTGDSTRKFSDTPQGTILNLDTYLTEATVENAADETTTSGSTGSTGNESTQTTYTSTKRGNQGVNTYAHDMKELRETFLNIDMMIINELKDLFIMVY